MTVTHRFFSQNALFRDSFPLVVLRNYSLIISRWENRARMALFDVLPVVLLCQPNRCIAHCIISHAIKTEWSLQGFQASTAEFVSKMEEVLVVLMYLFAISRARDYLEKRYDRALSLLEDDINADTPIGIDERICILWKVLCWMHRIVYAELVQWSNIDCLSKSIVILWILSWVSVFVQIIMWQLK